MLQILLREGYWREKNEWREKKVKYKTFSRTQFSGAGFSRWEVLEQMKQACCEQVSDVSIKAPFRGRPGNVCVWNVLFTFHLYSWFDRVKFIYCRDYRRKNTDVDYWNNIINSAFRLYFLLEVNIFQII